MAVFTIKREHLDNQGNYIGKTDISNFNGTIKAEPNLGVINIRSIKAKGSIILPNKTSIRSFDVIIAGKDIKSEESIVADADICAGNKIEVFGTTKSKNNIIAESSIFSLLSIRAGGYIRASSIKSRTEIYAKEGIYAYFGINGGKIRSGKDIMSEWGNIKAEEIIYSSNGRIVCSKGAIIAGYNIHANHEIISGASIESGGPINSNNYIEAAGKIVAGHEITANKKITAGQCIQAGLSIFAENIYCDMRIFAGLCAWKNPSPRDRLIAANVRKGEVAYGIYALKEDDKS